MVFSTAEKLIFVYSLALGFLRFSVLGSCFNFSTHVLNLIPLDALIIVHSVMACMYLLETISGAVTKTKLGTKWISIILSIALTVTFVVTYLVSCLHEMVWLNVLTIIFTCLVLGGHINCLKEILKNEYDLPAEQERYSWIKFFVTESEFVGKTMGGTLGISWHEKFDPKNHYWATIICIMCSICILVVAVWGSKKFKEQKNYDNLVKKFIIHTVFMLKSKLSNIEETNTKNNFSSEELERIKVVHSVLPLYVPVIILIGLKDIKFSLFAWQSQKLVLAFNEYYSFNPQLILIMYPMTVAITHPIFFFIVSPILKKSQMIRKWETTTRALCAFYLMAISISSALILECRLEKDNDHKILNKTMSRIMTTNLLPCTLKLTSRCSNSLDDTIIEPFSTKSMLCPLSEEYNSIRFQGSCYKGNKTEFLSITVLMFGLDEIYLATGFGYTIRPVEKNGNITEELATPEFFDHFHFNAHEKEFNSKIFLIYNVRQDHIVKLVPIKRPGVPWETDPGTGGPIEEYIYGYSSRISRLKSINYGPYIVLLDGKVIARINHNALSTFVILVGQEPGQNKTITSVQDMMRTYKRSVFEQLPQIITSSLSEMLIDCPGFMFAHKKVPEQWQEFVGMIWSFSCFLGNIAVILLNCFTQTERPLIVLIYASASSTVGIALVSVYLLDYFKEDYMN